MILTVSRQLWHQWLLVNLLFTINALRPVVLLQVRIAKLILGLMTVIARTVLILSYHGCRRQFFLCQYLPIARHEKLSHAVARLRIGHDRLHVQLPLRQLACAPRVGDVSV